jgi:hypothetical protein
MIVCLATVYRPGMARAQSGTEDMLEIPVHPRVAAVGLRAGAGTRWRATAHAGFGLQTQLPSLPPGCFLLSGFVLFGNELEPAPLCETEDGFEVELSVPNRDSPTHSKWRVEWRYTGRTSFDSVSAALRWQ